MAVDFTKLGKRDNADTVLHPRELFTVLRKESPRYQYPRDVQAEVWERWHEKRNERDLVIKMNTGGGKTVVGLLILKSLLNDGKGPAVYVTPDPYLTRQVLAEAAALGIDATDDADDPSFRRGSRILVANIYKLLNGRSAFGVTSEGIKIPIGSVVVDDAHACLATSEGQFTIRLNALNAPYKALFALFREDLRAQSATTLLDVEDHDPDKVLQVPYWAWIDKAHDVAKILHAARKTEELEFTWPLLAEVLPFCQCVFGGGEAEIAPRCLPIEAIPSFSAAVRRVFMTATLADDSVLVTHFDVSPDAARAPITPSRAGDVGDRLILIPQELNPEIDDEELRAFAAQLSVHHNVVVIVPSHHRAAMWKPYATMTLDAKGLSTGVERLKRGHVGLVVIVNKYDGIDLPDNACRVLVLDGLPDVRSKLDRVEQAALHGSDQYTASMVQRIEQGMGRGVRSNADHCVVLLSGRSLTRQLYSLNALEKFTPATRAQFELSQQLAAQLRGVPVAELRGVVDLVLGRDRAWVDASRGALVHVKYSEGGSVSGVALAQRAAFNAARVRDYRGACGTMQDAVNSEGDLRVRGWLRQQLAEYMHFIDPVESQRILLSASQDNRFVTRPLQGIDYQRLRNVEKEQGRAAADYLAATYASGNHLSVGVYGLLDALKFEPETATAFERSFADLARHIGFASQKPEAAYGRGPDVLCSMGSLQYLVVECKNGAGAEPIAKRDVDQLGGSMRWFADMYDKTCVATPVMVHPNHAAERTATPDPQMRVMTQTKLEELKTAFTSFSFAVAKGVWPPTPKALGALLTHHGLSADRFIGTYTVKMRSKK